MILYNLRCIFLYVVNWIYQYLINICKCICGCGYYCLGGCKYSLWTLCDITWKDLQKEIKNNKEKIKWEYVSESKYITLQIVNDNPQLPWYYGDDNIESVPGYYGLSQNPNLDWKFIEDNLDKPWMWYVISHRNFVTWPIVKKYSQLAWDWNIISLKSFITPKIVNDNPDIPWCWGSKYPCNVKEGLSSNPNLTLQFIKDNLTKRWCWYYLSNHPNLTMDWIIQLSKLPYDFNKIYKGLIPLCDVDPSKIPWNWYSLSINNNIKVKNIIKNSELPWIWNIMHQRNDITIEIVMHYKHLPWNWDRISHWTTLTWKMIVNNKNISWNWSKLSIHLNITLQIIKSNLDAPWQWYYVSHNPNITWQDIRNNPSLPWDYHGMSLNPNLSYQPFYHINLPWNWKKLQYNLYSKHPILVYRKEFKQFKKEVQPILDSHLKIENIINLIYEYIVDYPTHINIVNAQAMKKLFGG